jgi:hypothetical protein
VSECIDILYLTAEGAKLLFAENLTFEREEKVCIWGNAVGWGNL